MTRTRLLAVLLLLVLTTGWTATAEAKPKASPLVTISLTAVVEVVSDPAGLICSDVAVGGTVTARYTYDLRTPDSDPNDNTGVYVQEGAPSGFRVDLGDAIVATASSLVENQVRLVDNTAFDADYYLVLGNGALAPTRCGVDTGLIQFQLDDPTRTALTGVALPTTAPDLSRYAGNALEIYGVAGGDNYYLRASVNSATLCQAKKPKKC